MCFRDVKSRIRISISRPWSLHWTTDSSPHSQTQTPGKLRVSGYESGGGGGGTPGCTSQIACGKRCGPSLLVRNPHLFSFSVPVHLSWFQGRVFSYIYFTRILHTDLKYLILSRDSKSYSKFALPVAPPRGSGVTDVCSHLRKAFKLQASVLRLWVHSFLVR